MGTTQSLDLAWILGACRRAEIPIPPTVAVYVTLEVIQGLEYTTGSPLESGEWGREVHGDIRPGNVRVDRDGTVALARPSRRWGQDMDQLRHAAPEVASGEGTSPRSDVFAVGALLFEMLAGEPVYPQEDPQTLAKAIAGGFDPASRVRDVSLGSLATLVAHALVADPEVRAAAVDVLLAELMAFQRRTQGPPPQDLLADVVQRAIEAAPTGPPAGSAPPALDAFDEASLPGVTAAFDAVDAPSAAASGEQWEPLDRGWESDDSSLDDSSLDDSSLDDAPEQQHPFQHPWSVDDEATGGGDDEADDDAGLTLPTLEVAPAAVPRYAVPDHERSWGGEATGEDSMPPAPWERDSSASDMGDELEPRGGIDESSARVQRVSMPSADPDDESPEIHDPSIIDLYAGPPAPTASDLVATGAAEPAPSPEPARPATVGGGAYLFARGKAHGPLTLLEMEQQLARLRDPVALVAFEKGSWRPLSECASLLVRRPKPVDRREFHLFELGPLLLELGAGPSVRHITLWHGDDAAVLHLAGGRVWEAHAVSVPSMARQLLREEDLLSTEDLDTVEIVEDDTRTLNALRHRGLLTAGQVARLLRRRARRTLAAPFAWPGGQLLFHDTRRPPRSGTHGVDLAEAIAFVIRTHADPALVEGLFHQMKDHQVVVASPSLRHDLPLMPAEERFLADLPPTAPLGDAIGSFWDEGREEAYAAMFLCLELGLLTLE